MRVWLGLLVSLIGGVALGALEASELSFAAPFGDGMVLQRELPIPVWGRAPAGAELTVRLGAESVIARADDQGAWRAEFAARAATAAGQSLELELKARGAAKGLLRRDVLIGEVWLCSGQSNMAWPLSRAEGGAEAAKQAKDPALRLLTVPLVPAVEPLLDLDVFWRQSTPKTAARCSAVAFLFGRRLRAELGVPVGLIISAWGGTRIEPWISTGGFASAPSLASRGKRVEAQRAARRSSLAEGLGAQRAWLDAVERALADGGPLPSRPSFEPAPGVNRGSDAALFSGMIAGLAPYALRGALWYQGESNMGEGMAYATKLRALIGSWRAAFERDHAFFIVQIAPFAYRRAKPGALAEFWQAQAAVLDLPGTALAPTLDVGNWKDIHPRKKEPVAERLAALALRRLHGRSELPAGAPKVAAVELAGGAARLRFDGVGGGVIQRSKQPLEGFELRGADGMFHPAKAQLEGGVLTVRSARVSAPRELRYGWQLGFTPGLFGASGWPVGPFRRSLLAVE